MEIMQNEHFQLYLILFLVALLFITDEVMPYIKHGLGKMFGVTPKEEDAEKPATRGQMDKLSNYYNHDTTILLQSIDYSIKELNESIKGVHSNVGDINRNLANLEKVVKELEDNHREWEKYGIPAIIKKH